MCRIGNTADIDVGMQELYRYWGLHYCPSLYTPCTPLPKRWGSCTRVPRGAAAMMWGILYFVQNNDLCCLVLVLGPQVMSSNLKSLITSLVYTVLCPANTLCCHSIVLSQYNYAYFYNFSAEREEARCLLTKCCRSPKDCHVTLVLVMLNGDVFSQYLFFSLHRYTHESLAELVNSNIGWRLWHWWYILA